VPDGAPPEPGGAARPGVPDGAPPEPGGAAPGRPARRMSAAGAIIGLLLGLLGFALVVQVRSNTATDAGLSSARPDDLVRILADLDARQARLRQETSSLEQTQRELTAGSQGGAAALAEAKRRADALGILAGTLPAQGPGLAIRLQPGGQGIPAETVLDAVEELRGAGAEAMQIGDGATTVRVVASTYFADDRSGLLVDGAHLTGTYVITVIGDPQTMRTALNIPGGVDDTVRQRGGTVIVQEPGTVAVTALHHAEKLQYARPAS
jgi:uncharacterized protein YlxW (UPF0749 family)